MTAQRAEKSDQDSFWTAFLPLHGICPGVDARGVISALPEVHTNASRQQLMDYFNNGWTLTEVLFSGLASDAGYYQRPYHQLRHPLIFYYAHPAVLYVNKLHVAGLLNGPVNPEFEALFETGVDEMRWDDLHDGTQDIWPAVEAVRQYRREVYQVVHDLIATSPLLDGKPITMKDPMWALVMGFEHERIHFETSSVLMRELPIEQVRMPQNWPALAPVDAAAETRMVELPESYVDLGKSENFPTFGWDNEYGSEERHVSSFTASSTLISNAQYLEFVKAGGYGEERYWSREGWAWRRFRNIKRPTFWVSDGPDGAHRYKLRTIFSEIPLPGSWPAIVNFHEAKAYCAWRSEMEQTDTPYRLLTEAEHHALRDDTKPGLENALTYGSEHSVTQTPPNARGFNDVFGNVWQWCEDHFHPLTGGNPHPYYADFSAPCYDGEHQMILGGSFISTGDEATEHARFHFRPHFFQHAGMRIARSLSGNPSGNPKRIKNAAKAYETEEMLNAYMLMHWGSDAEIYDSALGSNKPAEVIHLPLACAELIRKHSATHGRVLDLGCAVGRSAFELTRDFDEVLGIDYSHEFIEAANKLKHTGKLAYYRKDSGDQGTPLIARLESGVNAGRVSFMQGDANNLPAELKDYDAVLLANVLCRLSNPVACLTRLHSLVKPGGVLVMTTPFSWLPHYTDPSRWLHGIEAVKTHLEGFELIHEQELPFMIREHRRKFEYIITKASVWRRK